ncbi:hypothetical protein [Siphonobacter sp. SORGH_AS_1065]|uniref:hypothetical protein n=1 Tax=Siphonobacter sp. SORGH_AS_1065 TaxID=3041795 RepID=UPI0027816289|nr:hypothetical protein [Siphonobacter sp. SORGH_AS_1065]MDQ1089130.1 hypothetical protein [Siphonobacter sp. SORGH_AS_1065]
MRKLPVCFLAMFLLLMNCTSDDGPSGCIRGKLIGKYCEGYVIKLFKRNAIGKTWTDMYDKSVTYENCALASFDTTIFSVGMYDIPLSKIPKDSLFYFTYREGGYSRVKFNICEPTASITITSINTCR